MIKTNNGEFYMSAGETCYTLRVSDGLLVSSYFGKRIEPEDDLSALGLRTHPEFTVPTVVCDGKKLRCALTFSNVEICGEKPTGGLAGGKTLKITFRDADIGLRAELYYTPYPRGGYTRRIVVTNFGGRPLTVSGLQMISGVNGGCVAVDTESGGNNKIQTARSVKQRKFTAKHAENFAAVTESECGSVCGAYGFLCAYGDGSITTEITDGGVRIYAGDGGSNKLAPGESCVSPEMTVVYSDRGVDGMLRVLHDILREAFGGDRLSRSKTVLFLPETFRGKATEAAAAVCELGCDVMAVDINAYSDGGLAEFSAACRSTGISLGLRVSAENTDAVSVAELEIAVASAVKRYGAGYVMITDSDAAKSFAKARAVCGLYTGLRKTFPELTVELSEVSGSDCRHSACYPPCSVRNIVKLLPESGLKSRFDRATFGGLGYEFDPISAGAEIKRAVRAQIFSYQDDAPTVMLGDLYRAKIDGGSCRISVAKDKSKAYAVCELPETDGARVALAGLDEHDLYHVRELGKTFSGAALMSCGIALPVAAADFDTYVLHLRQVADFE